ncbi:MAG: efflux RND transporter periplasmic adaptor subunit [Pseudomonadota bacterium]
MIDPTPRPAPPRGRRHWFHRLIPALILLVGVAVVAIILRGGESPEREKPDRPARLVETTPIEPTDERVILEAWGTVRPAREVTLQPQVGGVLRELGPEALPGGLPDRGERLVTIDPSDYRLAVRRAESGLTRARANLAQERGRHAVAQAEFMLAEVDDLSPEERRLMLREPQLDAAEAEVAAAEADRDEARLNLERTRIDAPFDALVLDRHADVGSRVNSGQNLLAIVDRTTFWVEFSLPSESLRWLQRDGGGRVTLFRDGAWAPGRSREGRILRVRGDVDEPGRMARVLVAVDDPLGLEADDRPELLLGSHVRGLVEGRRLEGVFALRPEWLRENDTVWVMDTDDTLAIREPELLHRGRDQVLVRGDLAAGDRVVTSDLGIPQAGMPLRTSREDR